MSRRVLGVAPAVRQTLGRRPMRSPLLALALIVVFAGTVLATAASGFHPTVLARGTMSESVHFNTGEVKFQTKDPVDFVTQTVTIDALGSSGWHAHPGGVVLFTVASGSVVRYFADCAPTVIAAGSAFAGLGDDTILVRNESTTTPAVVYVTFIVPAGASPLRIDRANPGCPQS